MTADDGGRYENDDLIDGVARGDSNAMVALCDRFLWLMFGTAFSVLRDRVLAERAVETAALSLWANPVLVGRRVEAVDTFLRLIAWTHAQRIRTEAGIASAGDVQWTSKPLDRRVSGPGESFGFLKD